MLNIVVLFYCVVLKSNSNHFGFTALFCFVLQYTVLYGLNHVVLCCTMLYGVVLCCTELNFVVLCCIVMNCFVPQSTVLYHVVLCCTMLYGVVLSCTVLNFVVLCCTMLTELCYVVLC